MRHATVAVGVVLVAIASAVSLSCSRSEPARSKETAAPATVASWTTRIDAIASPAGPSSSEPQLTVSDRGVILSWVETEGVTSRLKFAERTATGWSAPITVASGKDWFVTYADPPSVMRRSDGTLVANWLVVTDVAVEASNLQISYSTDDGKSWSAPLMPHHDGTKTQHAFASVFELPDKALGVVWIDASTTALMKDFEGGAMSLRFASFDAGWKQTANTAVDTSVCDCCTTTVATTSDGVLTAYRNRTEKEIRDISVSRLENGKWTEPISVHDDNWRIAACPINGPMLSARGRQVVVAWFTAKNDEGQAYAAFSNDAGRTWGTPIRIDDRGSLGRVDVELLDDGSAAAAWVEVADNRARFEMRRIEASGAKSPAIAVSNVSGESTSGYPRTARHGDELVFAWTENTPGPAGSEPTPSVHTAVASLRPR